MNQNLRLNHPPVQKEQKKFRERKKGRKEERKRRKKERKKEKENSKERSWHSAGYSFIPLHLVGVISVFVFHTLLNLKQM